MFAEGNLLVNSTLVYIFCQHGIVHAVHYSHSVTGVRTSLFLWINSGERLYRVSWAMCPCGAVETQVQIYLIELYRVNPG